jgi:hypothetical protein
MVKAGGFQTDSVVSCISAADHLSFRRLSIPLGSDEVSKRLVHEAIAREWEVAPRTISTDYIEIPLSTSPENRQLDCIAVVASESAIEALSMLLKQAGLVPLAIDASIAAVTRCIASPGAAQDENSSMLVVEVGSRGHTIAIGAHGTPSFVCSRHEGHSSAEEHKPCAAIPVQPPDGAASVATPAATKHQCLPSGMCAAELAGDINNVLQYVEDENLVHELPRCGIVIGADELGPPLINELAVCSRISLLALHEVLCPIAHSCIPRLPPDARIEDMITSIGLALYGFEHLTSGTVT